MDIIDEDDHFYLNRLDIKNLFSKSITLPISIKDFIKTPSPQPKQEIEQEEIIDENVRKVNTGYNLYNGKLERINGKYYFVVNQNYYDGLNQIKIYYIPEKLNTLEGKKYGYFDSNNNFIEYIKI
jgi:hypothetical protein